MVDWPNEFTCHRTTRTTQIVHSKCPKCVNKAQKWPLMSRMSGADGATIWSLHILSCKVIKEVGIYWLAPLVSESNPISPNPSAPSLADDSARHTVAPTQRRPRARVTVSAKRRGEKQEEQRRHVNMCTASVLTADPNNIRGEKCSFRPHRVN